MVANTVYRRRLCGHKDYADLLQERPVLQSPGAMQVRIILELFQEGQQAVCRSEALGLIFGRLKFTQAAFLDLHGY
jgi:hypothetical protein